MIRPDEVQSALVTYLKSKATIVAELPAGDDEIKEVQWQGTTFTYPNIRVKLSRLEVQSQTCDAFDASMSILVFSEEASSYQANRIVGIINTVLQQRSFSSQGVRFVLGPSTIISAIRMDSRTWRSEIILRGTIN